MENNRLTEQLTRAQHGAYVGAHDASLAYYTQRFRDRLNARSQREAAALASFEAAHRNLTNSPELATLLTGDRLRAFGGAACGFSNSIDATGMGLKIGAELLTNRIDPARYVSIMDAGLLDASNGGYDTHDRHVQDSARNVVNMAKHLAGAINAPGENSPGKLDLDRHMVVVSTEFGRTPYIQPSSDGGLDHWPWGFVTILIGGPITAEQSGIAGAIGENGRATSGYTPAEFRAALLLAQGIWPFSGESFAIGDIRGATSQVEAALLLRGLLGYPL